MLDSSVYDEDYFINGRKSGKSLYENYRYLPELTIPMAEMIVSHCGIEKGARILDFGCARGYLVKALRGLSYDAYGVDVSKWAIQNSDEETKPYLNWCDNSPPLLTQEFDWIIAKDVLEHIPHVLHYVDLLMNVAKSGIFVVVPLSKFDEGNKYVIEEYEKDITHCQRRTLLWWTSLFLKPGWKVESAYRVPGVKDNYYKPGWERGNGFITCRRISE